MFLRQLLNDEAGFILSAEAVLVGTVAVVGATVGLNAIATSVNAELTDVAFSIRSLDQSYSYEGFKGCGASTAGSSFKQEAVDVSLSKLCDQIEADELAEEKAHKDAHKHQEELKKKADQDKKKKKQEQDKKKNRKLQDEAI